MKKDEEIQILKKRVKELEKSETEHQRAEEVLTNALGEWWVTFDSAKDLIMMLDAGFKISRANLATTRFLDKPIKEIVGKTCYRLFHGTDRPPEGCPLEKMRKTKKHEEKEFYLSEKDIWILVSIDPILDKKGNVRGAVHIIRDVTESKQAEEKILTTNERLNHLLSSSSGVIYTAKCSGDYAATYISDSVTRMVGFKPQEFFGESSFWIDHIHPDDVPHISTEVPKVFAENFHNYEYRFRCKDGTYIWVRDEMKLIRGVDGKPVEIIGFWLDITELKQVEEELKENETRYRELFENIDSGVAVYEGKDGGRDFIFQDFNEAAERIDQIAKQDLIGKSVTKVFPGIVEFGLLEVFRRVWQTGLPEHYPITFYKDKRIKGWRDNYVYKLPSGEVVSIYEDITERKQVEKALQESEERLSLALEGTGLGTWDHNYRTGKIVRNERWAVILGYTLDEIKPSLDFWKNLIHPDDTQQVMELMVDCEEGKTNDFRAEYRMRVKSGEWRWILDWGKIVERDKNSKPLRAAGTHHDITERKKTEEALKENEERYRQIYQFSPDSIIIHDMDMNILDANNKAVKEFGYSKVELLKKTIFELHPETELKHSAQVLAAIKKKDMLNVETKFVRKDGSIFLAEAIPCKYTLGSKPIIHVVIRDITERKQAEEILRESEEKFRSSIENMLDCFGIYSSIRDVTGKIVDFRIDYVNEAACTSNLMSKEEQLGKLLCELWPNRRKSGLFDKYCDVVETGKPLIKESIVYEDVYKKQRLSRVFDIRIAKLGDGFIAAWRDITERKQAEERLKEYSESQAILIKEINHRVRNNLTEIIGILYSEEDIAERKGKLEYLPNIQSLVMRIKGLSTVHSLLSESEWKPPKITKLCERIVNVVIKSLSSSKDVNILVTSSDYLISSDKAHYLGMVINELATNSIKYAFNKRDKLNINIDIKEEDDNIILNYRDDGPGYPREILKEAHSIDSIGFELIQGIVKNSLLGDLKLKNDNGAVTILTFKNIQ